MTIEEVSHSILQNFAGSSLQRSEDGDYFFFYGTEDKFPFTTIVTHDDAYDNVSQLNREGCFRLNIGTDKTNFDSMFAHVPHEKGFGGYINSGIDFTEQDTVFPHPVYGTMHWISVVNPSQATFDALLPQLYIAYENAVRKENRKAGQ